MVSDTLACEGDTISLDLNNVSLSNYTVAFNGGTPGSATHFKFIADASSPDYTLDIVDVNSPSCPAFTIHDSIRVESKVILPVMFSATEICVGETVQVTNQSFYNQYSVFVNGIFNDSNVTGVFEVENLEDGDIILSTAQGLACVQESSPQTITVNTPRKPGFTISGSNRTWDFTDTTSQIQSRTWDFGDNSAQATTPTASHTYAANGAFIVRLVTMDDKGCSDSAQQTINSDNVGMMDVLMTQVKVYPNPASDYVQIESGIVLDGAELWTIQGQQLAIQTTKSDQYHFDLSGLAPGAYLIKLKWEDQVSIVRFIIE